MPGGSGSLTEPAASSRQRRAGRGRRRATAAGAVGVTAGHVREMRRGAHLPYILLVAVIASSLAWMWVRGGHAVRAGTLAMSGAMFAASIARLVLPESRIGMIASRKRLTDVVTLAALGAGLMVAGLALAPL
jgi:hypothetical protein